MSEIKNEARQPDHTAEKHAPNYRSKNTPRAEATRECHTVKPPAAPSSAAENHDDANQKCDATPLAASKDEREKSTG